VYRNLSPGTIGIDKPFQECLCLARDTGFEGIDVGFFQAESAEEAEAINCAIAEHGLRSGASGLPVEFRKDKEQYQESFQRFRQAAPLLAAAGVTRVLTWLMPCSDELPYLENFRLHADRLTPVAEVLYENNCRLGLEYVGTPSMREGRKYSFIHTQDQLMELCGAIGQPNVGILLDSWHWFTSGGTPEDIRSLSADQVVGVHLNDAPKGVPMEEQRDNVRLLPCESGVIDLVGFVTALREMGYDGPATVEPFSDRVRSLPAEEAARETSESLKTLWKKAGIPL
jgi:sugar phosphate isomerase/epimerase